MRLHSKYFWFHHLQSIRGIQHITNCIQYSDKLQIRRVANAQMALISLDGVKIMQAEGLLLTKDTQISAMAAVELELMKITATGNQAT